MAKNIIIIVSTLFVLQQGLKNGTYTFYSEYGIKYVVNYCSDTLHGIYWIYQKNGVLVETGDFEKGFHNGIAKRYDRNGDIQSIIEYDKGNICSQEYYNYNKIVGKDVYNDTMLFMNILYSGGIGDTCFRTKKIASPVEGFIDSYDKIRTFNPFSIKR